MITISIVTTLIMILVSSIILTLTIIGISHGLLLTVCAGQGLLARALAAIISIYPNLRRPGASLGKPRALVEGFGIMVRWMWSLARPESANPNMVRRTLAHADSTDSHDQPTDHMHFALNHEPP